MTFRSYLMGGFECSTHRDKGGRRLDLIASTRHDEFAGRDYSRLTDIGIGVCRDGVRWHLIEPEPFRYDFSSLNNQINAARTTGVQVIWDYFHYGFPDDLDIFSPEFVERLLLLASHLQTTCCLSWAPSLLPARSTKSLSFRGRRGTWEVFTRRCGGVATS